MTNTISDIAIRDMNDAHHDLSLMKEVAMYHAKKHNCNYNIILLNPTAQGEYDRSEGSTYEMVVDSYFEKPRPNVKLLHKTDDLLGRA